MDHGRRRYESRILVSASTATARSTDKNILLDNDNLVLLELGLGETLNELARYHSNYQLAQVIIPTLPHPHR